MKKNELRENISNKKQEKSAFFFRKVLQIIYSQRRYFRSAEADPILRLSCQFAQNKR
jgi:hypothetical protein